MSAPSVPTFNEKGVFPSQLISAEHGWLSSLSLLSCMIAYATRWCQAFWDTANTAYKSWLFLMQSKWNHWLVHLCTEASLPYKGAALSSFCFPTSRYSSRPCDAGSCCWHVLPTSLFCTALVRWVLIHRCFTFAILQGKWTWYDKRKPVCISNVAWPHLQNRFVFGGLLWIWRDCGV